MLLTDALCELLSCVRAVVVELLEGEHVEVILKLVTAAREGAQCAVSFRLWGLVGISGCYGPS